MARRGTCSITLTFELEFADDGNDAAVVAIRSGEHLVDMAHEQALLAALPEALFEQVKAEAWEDSEPVDDGHAPDREVA